MERFADTDPHRLLVAIDERALVGYATSGTTQIRSLLGY